MCHDVPGVYEIKEDIFCRDHLALPIADSECSLKCQSYLLSVLRSAAST